VLSQYQVSLVSAFGKKIHAQGSKQPLFFFLSRFITTSFVLVLIQAVRTVTLGEKMNRV